MIDGDTAVDAASIVRAFSVGLVNPCELYHQARRLTLHTVVAILLLSNRTVRNTHHDMIGSLLSLYLSSNHKLIRSSSALSLILYQSNSVCLKVSQSVISVCVKAAASTPSVVAEFYFIIEGKVRHNVFDCTQNH